MGLLRLLLLPDLYYGAFGSGTEIPDDNSRGKGLFRHLRLLQPLRALFALWPLRKPLSLWGQAATPDEKIE